MTALRCFMVMAPAALAGVALGVNACTSLDVALPDPMAWGLLCGAALLTIGIGTLVLYRLVVTRHMQEAKAAAARQLLETARFEANRRLRHEIRGALSPVLLASDRLLCHQDPTVQRAADIMARAVQKAADLLADPAPEPTLPAHP